MDGTEFVYPLACCCGFIFFIIAIVVFIIAAKKKMLLLALLLGIPLICIGVSMALGSAIFWWDDGTYIPDDLSDTVIDDFDYDDDYYDDNYYDDDSDLYDELPAGYVKDYQYGFSIYVGSEYADGVFVDSELTGTVGSLSYCMPTMESTDTMSLCESGYFPAFDITIMTHDQWDDVTSNEFSMNVYEEITEDAYIVYLFSHPNGDYPSDVPSSEAFFDEVISSFEKD